LLLPNLYARDVPSLPGPMMATLLVSKGFPLEFNFRNQKIINPKQTLNPAIKNKDVIQIIFIIDLILKDLEICD
jgi:hypothetical protein